MGIVNIYSGNEDIPAGWRSLYYGEKIIMNQLVYEVNSIKDKEIIITKIFSR